MKVNNKGTVLFIKSQRLSWLSHVKRILDKRSDKNTFHERTGNQRKEDYEEDGLQDVEDDLKKMTIRNWWNRVKYTVKKIWRRFGWVPVSN